MSVSICQVLSNFSTDFGSQKILSLAEQDVRVRKRLEQKSYSITSL